MECTVAESRIMERVGPEAMVGEYAHPTACGELSGRKKRPHVEDSVRAALAEEDRKILFLNLVIFGATNQS